MLNKIKEIKLNKSIVISIIGIVLFIIVDQLTKFLFAKNMIIIPNVLRFSIVTNTGGAFSFFSGDNVMVIILNFILIAMVARFIFMYKDRVRKLMGVALVLVIAGGTSNLIDRVFKGYVMDFIDFNPLVKFPVFNLADITLIIGWVIFVICILLDIRGDKVWNTKK
ncbi:MAG: signal peptidase II [Oscillospiraceae bacterium]|nr:signal peptidase II [Oscillospiraceae bacterium]